jgi:hypothetical protein
MSSSALVMAYLRARRDRRSSRIPAGVLRPIPDLDRAICVRLDQHVHKGFLPFCRFERQAEQSYPLLYEYRGHDDDQTVVDL